MTPTATTTAAATARPVSERPRGGGPAAAHSRGPCSGRVQDPTARSRRRRQPGDDERYCDAVLPPLLAESRRRARFGPWTCRQIEPCPRKLSDTRSATLPRPP